MTHAAQCQDATLSRAEAFEFRIGNYLNAEVEL